MSERPFEWKRDGGGLALFVVGAFVSVLMVKSLFSDQPLEQLTGTAAIASIFAGSFGAFPCLVLAAGVGFLGARSFVTASEAGALRHALGLIGLALGLSILFGAFSDTGGGKFGLLTGGALGLSTHATLGGLAGLCVLLASAWFAWLREPGALHEEQIRSSIEEREQVADPGVTAAEAAGLIPLEVPHGVLSARKSAYTVSFAPPTSPYPEDVRLKGQVPPGARPIANPNPAAPLATPLQPAREALAEPLVERIRPVDAEPAQPSEDRVPVDEALAESAPERPSWERTGLGEDDEPVDAYGTPRSLIESLRKAQEEMVAIPESPAAPVEPELVLAESGDDLPIEDDDEEESEETDEDEDEDDDEDADETEEVELFADEEEDALAEEIPAAMIAPREIDQAVMAESDEFVEITEELVPASELEQPQGEAQALAQTTIFDFTEEPQAGVELFPEGLPEEPAVAEAAAPETELVPQPVAALEDDTQDDIEIEIGEEEPEVVLQPQAAPAERAHKSLSVDPERAKLLVQAGTLFVERGRVAVSMLQREYGMDFDAACKVLDELQDIGLIGPYLGGQRRDILLTRDQWMEKAGAP